LTTLALSIDQTSIQEKRAYQEYRSQVRTHSIQGAFLSIAVAAAVASPLRAQVPPSNLQQLVKDVVYNELHDRERASYWAYHVDKQVGGQRVVKEEIETSHGPIFRLLANGTTPLTADQKRQEDQRLDHLLRDPSEQARVMQQQKDDEARMERLMQLMPAAFLYDYDGSPEPKQVRLKFRPNPAFTPPTYEARVFHSLAGTVLIDTDHKRLIDMSGVTIDRVDFAYGLLGHVEKGGTFEIHREPVTATHWKTNLVAVHVNGKIVFFKTISKDQREARSGFRPVPLDISLAQAKDLLDQTAESPAASALVSAPGVKSTAPQSSSAANETR
jgi:hypothetical protein